MAMSSGDNGSDRRPARERTLPALLLASAALLLAFAGWPSTDQAAARPSSLGELPRACDLLPAARAAELLAGAPARKPERRHRPNRSTCGWTADDRFVGLGLFAISTAAVDYRRQPKGKFAAAVSGIVDAGEFAGTRNAPGAGAFEFAGDDSFAAWVNSGIPVRGTLPRGNATHEAFFVVTTRGFADETQARRAVAELTAATQRELLAAAD